MQTAGCGDVGVGVGGGVGVGWGGGGAEVGSLYNDAILPI